MCNGVQTRLGGSAPPALGLRFCNSTHLNGMDPVSWWPSVPHCEQQDITPGLAAAPRPRRGCSFSRWRSDGGAGLRRPRLAVGPVSMLGCCTLASGASCSRVSRTILRKVQQGLAHILCNCSSTNDVGALHVFASGASCSWASRTILRRVQQKQPSHDDGRKDAARCSSMGRCSGTRTPHSAAACQVYCQATQFLLCCISRIAAAASQRLRLGVDMCKQL